MHLEVEIPYICFYKSYDMKVNEEIFQLVEELPDEFLVELRDFIKELNKAPKDHSHLTLNLKKIVLEDHNLLKRLAQ